MKQRSKRKPGAAPSRATEARTWIKEPLAIFAAGADRGVVVEVELVASGQQPATAVDAVCDATRHVVLPGLVNGHHHLYRTLARAHPQAINKELFPWLTASWSFLKRSVGCGRGHGLRMAFIYCRRVRSIGPPSDWHLPVSLTCVHLSGRAQRSD
jgi:hypothetical protein